MSKVTICGYEPGSKIVDTIVSITAAQFDTFNQLLDRAHFWGMATRSEDGFGTDGSVWLLEVYKSKQYHLVVRYTPEKGTAYRKVCEYLRSLTPIKNDLNRLPEEDY